MTESFSRQLGILSLLVPMLLPLIVGCSFNAPEEATESIADVEQSAEVESLLEPFDPPPFEELEQNTIWIDLPVLDGLEILREKQAKTTPLVSVEEALAMKNDSPESNEKILSAISRLPKNDEEVDWNAKVVRHFGGEVNSFNPIMINSSTEMDLLEMVGLQLIGFDAGFQPFAVKWAVQSWQTSEDRMMDKFVLRDDLTWSDGTPLTAHDVAFSFHTIMNPKVPVPAVRSSTQELRWVHAYDDHTVVIFHKEPMASWTENIQFPIIPKHIYENSLADDYTMQNSEYHLKFENQPVTCGPYEIVKRVRGKEIILRRREGYYMVDGRKVRPKPFLKEIHNRIITDPNTARLALKSGLIDEAAMSAETWLTQSSDQDFYERNTKVSGLEWTEFHFEWNCKSQFFNDKRVRRAMSYAYDHRGMLEKMCYGLYQPGTGVFHPTGWMASQNIKPFKQDFDKAEALLNAAGWIDHDEDGIRDKEINGRLVPFEFTIITYQSSNSIKICTLLKNNLDQIGIVCHVKPTEFTVKVQLAMDHKFDAMLGGWGTGTDPSTLDNIFTTGASRNHSQYSNARVDELFKLAQREFDRDKRAALYAEIHEILYDEQPNTWLFYRSSFFGLNKKLRGFNFSPRGPYGVRPGFLSIWVPVSESIR